jgi:transcriptional regulator with XRE-family HTH domain
VGARIRELRERANVTQEQLAWSSDLGKGYLSQIEAGKRLPSLAVLGAIAKSLRVPLRETLPEE